MRFSQIFSSRFLNTLKKIIGFTKIAVTTVETSHIFTFYVCVAHNWTKLMNYLILDSVGFWAVTISDSYIHWENYISISFHSEWDMIVVTVFEPNGNSFCFKNCHHDHILINVKGNGNVVFSVCYKCATC